MGGIKLHKTGSQNGLIILGLIKTINPQTPSARDPSCFGWSANGDCIKAGVRYTSCWGEFIQGDYVTFKFDAVAGALLMKIERLGRRCFIMDVADRRAGRIHVQLGSQLDHVELIATD